jgi:signal transduction histidine kinase
VSIRARLIRILALPAVAMLVLLTVVVAGDIGQYRAASGTAAAATLALSTQDLVQELQEERGLTSGLLGGDVGFRADLPPERVRVDRERARLSQAAPSTVTGAAAVRAALGGLGDLDTLRARIDAGKVNRAAAFGYFTDRVAALGSVDFGLDRSVDPVLRKASAVLKAQADLREAVAQERAYLNGVFSAGGFKTGEYRQFAGIRASREEAQNRFFRFATPAQRDRFVSVLDTGATSEGLVFEAVALNSTEGRTLLVDPQSWWSALTTVLDGVREVQQSVGADIRYRAGELRAEASRRLGLLLLLVALCLAGAFALVVSATRSITRPLVWLAAEADALASRRLPEAVARTQATNENEAPVPPAPVRVPRRASSEICSVARALDRVQGTAYALATEQAMLRRTTTESLANLGRRNQNLLRRQIGFITRLEQEESDPSGLANLFELDHLATRMRRNAESLLVLAGEATPRRWAVPLPISDVIRAAVSEVEEYRRVALRRIDDAYVNGAYVTGLAHMIAELVENGLAFSPPDLDVEVQGRQIGGQYLIAITDQGIGMAPDDMARANARLRGEESFLLAPTRFLGHYVIGHLAQQMSVNVQLGASPVTGVTARVVLPTRLLAQRPERLAPEPGTTTLPASATLAVPNPLAIGTRPVVEYIVVSENGRPAPGRPTPDRSTPDRPAPSWTTPTEPQHAYAQQPQDHGETRRDHGEMRQDRREMRRDREEARQDREDTGPGRDDSPPRTHNGLTKRRPRTRHLESLPSAVGTSDRPAILDDAPAKLRDRMTALRAGVHKAEIERTQQGQTGHTADIAHTGESPGRWGANESWGPNESWGANETGEGRP